MRRLTISVKAFALLVISLAGSGQARAEQSPAHPAVPAVSAQARSDSAAVDSTAKALELKAEVPALSQLHEVIFQLWHDAWPASNAALMRELLPRVQQDFAKVQKSELPGILRDRKDAWAAGLKSMGEKIAAYEKAAAGNDDKALFLAVEALHSSFEAQVRIIRPHMKELEDYHVNLYQIFHQFQPNHQIERLAAATDYLQVSCAALESADIPRWYTGAPAALKEQIRLLCNRTAELKAAVSTGDWNRIDPAVQVLHGQYQKVEALFE